MKGNIFPTVSAGIVGILKTLPQIPIRHVKLPHATRTEEGLQVTSVRFPFADEGTAQGTVMALTMALEEAEKLLGMSRDVYLARSNKQELVFSNGIGAIAIQRQGEKRASTYIDAHGRFLHLKGLWSDKKLGDRFQIQTGLADSRDFLARTLFLPDAFSSIQLGRKGSDAMQTFHKDVEPEKPYVNPVATFFGLLTFLRKIGGSSYTPFLEPTYSALCVLRTPEDGRIQCVTGSSDSENSPDDLRNKEEGLFRSATVSCMREANRPDALRIHYAREEEGNSRLVALNLPFATLPESIVEDLWRPLRDSSPRRTLYRPLKTAGDPLHRWQELKAWQQALTK